MLAVRLVPLTAGATAFVLRYGRVKRFYFDRYSFAADPRVLTTESGAKDGDANDLATARISSPRTLISSASSFPSPPLEQVVMWLI